MAALRDGYAALAEWIADKPDYETFIFRKFDGLSARNLLHLESQILSLEAELNVYDTEVRKHQDDVLSQSARKWETFSENAKDPNRPEYQRLILLDKISDKLKEYQDTLLRQRDIAAVGKPSARPLRILSDYFKPMSKRPVLGGRAKHKLDDIEDLAAIRPPTDKDVVSRYLQDHWMFKGKPVGDPHEHIEHIKEAYIVRTVAAISTIVAAILLIGAILSLSFVRSEAARLGVVAGFTVLFALSISLLTNAKRVEIFAATAAYAAVLVVFVSGDFGSSKNCMCIAQNSS